MGFAGVRAGVPKVMGWRRTMEKKEVGENIARIANAVQVTL